MRLEGSGDAIELRLLGYQFPETEEGWDANWLVVEILAQHQGRGWRAQDAALLTGDVAALARWLERIALGKDVPEELGFIEPCLTFYIRESSVAVRALHIDVAHELSPPWLTEDERIGEGVRLRFSAEPAALRAASASLRSQLNAFPARSDSDRKQ